VFWKLNLSVAGGAVDSHPEQFRGCFQQLLTVWAVEPEIGHAILRLAEYLKKIPANHISRQARRQHGN
jgi:hypothetical protein